MAFSAFKGLGLDEAGEFDSGPPFSLRPPVNLAEDSFLSKPFDDEVLLSLEQKAIAPWLAAIFESVQLTTVALLVRLKSHRQVFEVLKNHGHETVSAPTVRGEACALRHSAVSEVKPAQTERF